MPKVPNAPSPTDFGLVVRRSPSTLSEVRCTRRPFVRRDLPGGGLRLRRYRDIDNSDNRPRMFAWFAVSYLAECLSGQRFPTTTAPQGHRGKMLERDRPCDNQGSFTSGLYVRALRAGSTCGLDLRALLAGSVMGRRTTRRRRTTRLVPAVRLPPPARGIGREPGVSTTGSSGLTRVYRTITSRASVRCRRPGACRR